MIQKQENCLWKMTVSVNLLKLKMIKNVQNVDIVCLFKTFPQESGQCWSSLSRIRLPWSSTLTSAGRPYLAWRWRLSSSRSLTSRTSRRLISRNNLPSQAPVPGAQWRGRGAGSPSGLPRRCWRRPGWGQRKERGKLGDGGGAEAGNDIKGF